MHRTRPVWTWFCCVRYRYLNFVFVVQIYVIIHVAENTWRHRSQLEENALKQMAQKNSRHCPQEPQLRFRIRPRGQELHGAYPCDVVEYVGDDPVVSLRQRTTPHSCEHLENTTSSERCLYFATVDGTQAYPGGLQARRDFFSPLTFATMSIFLLASFGLAP